MKLKYLASGWLLMLLVDGCAPSTVMPTTQVLPSARNIVVVPSLPEVLLVATRGFTVFGNNLDQPSISNWHLDQLAYQTAEKALTPRFHVSEAVPDGVLVDEQSRLDAMTADGMTTVGDLVKQSVHVGSAPDLYIILCVSVRSHAYVDTPSTPYFFQDVGMSQQLGPLGLPPPGPPELHSFLLMSVVDGKTFKVLYDTPLLMPPGSNVRHGFLMNASDPYPERPLYHFEWRDRWANLTSDQQAEVKAGIEDLLTTSLAYTLKNSLLDHG